MAYGYRWFSFVTFVLIKSVSSQCTFDAPFASSSWHDNTRGTLTFTETGMSGWSFSQTSGAGTTVVSTWDCLNSTLSNSTRVSSYLVFRSKTRFLYPDTTSFVYSYLCMKLTKITDVSYYYYQAYGQDLSVASERLKFSTSNAMTSSSVCDPSPSAPTAEYHVLIKSGSEAAAAITCPNSLLLSADYSYYDSDETVYCDTTSDKWDGCSNTSEMVYDYTTCTQQIAYSVGGRVWCVANVNNGRYDYTTVYNQDTSLDGTAKRFSCISSDGSRASVAPNNCSVIQVPSTIPKQADAKAVYDGAHRVVFGNTYTTCGPTSSSSLSGGVIAAISIGVIMFVWFWTVLWIILVGLTVYFLVLMLIMVREALTDDIGHNSTKSTSSNGDVIRTPTDVNIDNRFLKHKELKSSVFSNTVTPIHEGFITGTDKDKHPKEPEIGPSKLTNVDEKGWFTIDEPANKLPPIRGTTKVHSPKGGSSSKHSPKDKKTKAPSPREGTKNKPSPKQGRPASSSPRRGSSSSKLSPKLSPKGIGTKKPSSGEKIVDKPKNTSPKQSPKLSLKAVPKQSPKLSPKAAQKQSPEMSPKTEEKQSPNMSPKATPKLTHMPTQKAATEQSPKLSPKTKPTLKSSSRENSQAKLSPKLTPKLPPKDGGDIKPIEDAKTATMSPKESNMKTDSSPTKDSSDANRSPKLPRKENFTTKPPERKSSVSEASPKPSSKTGGKKRKPSPSSTETSTSKPSPKETQKEIATGNVSVKEQSDAESSPKLPAKAAHKEITTGNTSATEQSDAEASPKLPPTGRPSRKPSPSLRARSGSTLSSRGSRTSKPSPSPGPSPYGTLARKVSPKRRPQNLHSKERSSIKLTTKEGTGDISLKGNTEKKVSDKEKEKKQHKSQEKEPEIDLPTTDNIVTAMEISHRQLPAMEETEIKLPEQKLDGDRLQQDATDATESETDTAGSNITQQIFTQSVQQKDEANPTQKETIKKKLTSIAKPRSKDKTDLTIVETDVDKGDIKHETNDSKIKHAETAETVPAKEKTGTQLTSKEKTATRLPIKYNTEGRFSSKPKIDLKHVLIDKSNTNQSEKGPTSNIKQSEITHMATDGKPALVHVKQTAHKDKSDTTAKPHTYTLAIKISPKESEYTKNKTRENTGTDILPKQEIHTKHASGVNADVRLTPAKKNKLTAKDETDLKLSPRVEQQIKLTTGVNGTKVSTKDENDAKQSPKQEKYYKASPRDEKGIKYLTPDDKINVKDTQRSPRDEIFDTRHSPSDNVIDSKRSPREEKDNKHSQRDTQYTTHESNDEKGSIPSPEDDSKHSVTLTDEEGRTNSLSKVDTDVKHTHTDIEMDKAYPNILKEDDIEHSQKVEIELKHTQKDNTETGKDITDTHTP